jgi:hypothetical protein
MMVLVEALDPFVVILPDDMVSAVRGDRVMVPKRHADKLVQHKMAKFVASKAAPENKVTGPAPEVKTQPAKPPRAAKKAASQAE